jgi:hypothetical protein
VIDQRGQLLRAALGFVGLPSNDHALHVLRSWLDSWSGIGPHRRGMHRQGFDLQLTQYDDRAGARPSYTTGMEHSPTSATSTGWGAHALARDAAGGVGGATTGHERLGRSLLASPNRRHTLGFSR